MLTEQEKTDLFAALEPHVPGKYIRIIQEAVLLSERAETLQAVKWRYEWPQGQGFDQCWACLIVQQTPEWGEEIERAHGSDCPLAGYRQQVEVLRSE